MMTNHIPITYYQNVSNIDLNYALELAADLGGYISSNGKNVYWVYKINNDH
jgi:hypothetical protein